jgi:hypothetical protein
VFLFPSLLFRNLPTVLHVPFSVAALRPSFLVPLSSVSPFLLFSAVLVVFVAVVVASPHLRLGPQISFPEPLFGAQGDVITARGLGSSIREDGGQMRRPLVFR